MTATTDGSQNPQNRGRPPRAYVGSQISRDEEMFGALFDGGVVRRFMTYVRPYRRQLVLAIAAVLVVTSAQLAIPLIIRHGIDNVLLAEGGDTAGLSLVVAVFAAVIAVNYAANWLQDRLIGITGEHVIFDLRQAMYAHLQDVSLSFMDKTETGRMMSRLTGDV
ncbi:MAG: ABC transporter transmembrane domain-containing protein, partial [Alphaproteobacteria bacterium]|nr:ABC transporter transmembrane domain-containing protein [Alphaproteobacteria bacterium]